MKKQYTTVLICDKPRTQILLDKQLCEKEKKRRITRYLDKKGKLKIETVKDHIVYGIKIENK